MDDRDVMRVCRELDSLLESETRAKAPRLSSEDIEHLDSMIDRIPLLLSEGKREKVMRWIGFMQGYLVHAGLLTLEEAKRMCMPRDGREFVADLDSREALQLRSRAEAARVAKLAGGEP